MEPAHVRTHTHASDAVIIRCVDQENRLAGLVQWSIRHAVDRPRTRPFLGENVSLACPRVSSLVCSPTARQQTHSSIVRDAYQNVPVQCCSSWDKLYRAHTHLPVLKGSHAFSNRHRTNRTINRSGCRCRCGWDGTRDWRGTTGSHRHQHRAVLSAVSIPGPSTLVGMSYAGALWSFRCRPALESTAVLAQGFTFHFILLKFVLSLPYHLWENTVWIKHDNYFIMNI